MESWNLKYLSLLFNFKIENINSGYNYKLSILKFGGIKSFPGYNIDKQKEHIMLNMKGLINLR